VSFLWLLNILGSIIILQLRWFCIYYSKAQSATVSLNSRSSTNWTAQSIKFKNKSRVLRSFQPLLISMYSFQHSGILPLRVLRHRSRSHHLISRWKGTTAAHWFPFWEFPSQEKVKIQAWCKWEKFGKFHQRISANPDNHLTNCEWADSWNSRTLFEFLEAWRILKCWARAIEIGFGSHLLQKQNFPGCQ